MTGQLGGVEPRPHRPELRKAPELGIYVHKMNLYGQLIPRSTSTSVPTQWHDAC